MTASELNPGSVCCAFNHHQLLARGALVDVVRAAKLALEAGANEPLLIFDEASSRQIELDFCGTLDEVLARLRPAEGQPPAAARGPGRPKLGVVSREVTLLPRHWEWLAQQPGGASAILRHLVEQAARGGTPKERARRAVEATERFMRVIAGDLGGYEEALRALYRGERDEFRRLITPWPVDVRDHLLRLAANPWNPLADAG